VPIEIRAFAIMVISLEGWQILRIVQTGRQECDAVEKEPSLPTSTSGREGPILPLQLRPRGFQRKELHSGRYYRKIVSSPNFRSRQGETKDRSFSQVRAVAAPRPFFSQRWRKFDRNRANF